MKKLRCSVSYAVILAGIFSFTAVSKAQALTVTFPDPVGDYQGINIDVTGIVLTFTKNGNYQIDLTADANHPFLGAFRVNINLFNPSAVSTGYSFFSVVCKQCDVFDTKTNNSDFNLLVPTTTLTLKTGHSKTLAHWAVGNQVSISSYTNLGNPQGVTLFRSSVQDSSLTSYFTHEDTIGYDNTLTIGTLDNTNGVAIIQP